MKEIIMKRLLLCGAMLALPMAAKADLVWNITPMIDVITDLGNPVSITGQFTTDDLGNGLTVDVVLKIGPTLSTEIDFNTDTGGLISSGPTEYVFEDASNLVSLVLDVDAVLDGTLATVAIDQITIGGDVLVPPQTTDVHLDVIEPNSLAVLAVGLCGITFARRRKFI